MSEKFVWDAIVVTSASPLQSIAYDLELLSRVGYSRVLLSVCDPGVRLGSGGATMNALQQAAAAMCAQQNIGYNADVVRGKAILVLHSGGDSQRMPLCSVRGKAFTALPSVDEHEHINSPLDFLIRQLTALMSTHPTRTGVLVGATDVMLLLPPSFVWRHPSGVTGLAILSDAHTARNHGVWCVESQEKNLAQEQVTRILQKPSLQDMEQHGAIRSDGLVLLDSGLVHFACDIACAFLHLASAAPFAACTSAGVDAGMAPLRFELYTDVLMALDPSLTRAEFIDMETPAGVDGATMLHARDKLWALLRDKKFYVICGEQAKFAHIGTLTEYMSYLQTDHEFRVPFGLQSRAHTYVRDEQACDAIGNTDSHKKNGVVINSVLLGTGNIAQTSLIEHSYLTGTYHVGSNSVVSGVRSINNLHVVDNRVVQQITLNQQYLSKLKNVQHLDAFLAQRRHLPSFLSSLSHAHPTFGASPAPLSIDPSLAVPSPINVLLVYGTDDAIKEKINSAKATFCGIKWSQLIQSSVTADASKMSNVTEFLSSFTPSRSALFSHEDAEAIWGHVPNNQRCMWNARLFPLCNTVDNNPLLLMMNSPSSSFAAQESLYEWRASPRLSLEDILACADAQQEVRWRHKVSVLVDLEHIRHILITRKSINLQTIIPRIPKHHFPLLFSLLDSLASSTELRDIDIVTRAICTIADTLCLLVPTYPRFHTANNPEWRKHIDALERGDSGAVRELAVLRDNALASGQSDAIIRAARHYDSAWHALIARGVSTVSVTYDRSDSCSFGRWAATSSPVRLDIMGGWSDTPPVTYEHGGAVTNVAVTVNGIHPIGAAARLTQQSHDAIIVRAGNKPRKQLDHHHEKSPVVLSFLSQFLDYSNPLAPASLIKCTLLCMGLVQLNSSLSLHEQLSYHAGRPVTLEIYTWSVLPQGTGLGVSSILSATVCKAIGLAFNRDYSDDAIVNLVLLIEQKLTSGAGWQDQIGGMWPGFKTCFSPPKLPLQVFVKSLPVSPAIVSLLNRHFLLIHTGHSRLAKNLLSNVLIRWYQRDAAITQVVDTLVKYTDHTAKAIQEGDVNMVGEMLTLYYECKKKMAAPREQNPSSTGNTQSAADLAPSIENFPVEPPHVTHLIEHLSPLICGKSLVGAGGGGYLLIVTKMPLDQANTRQQIEAIVTSLNQKKDRPATQTDYVICSCEIDQAGYKTVIED